MSFAQFFDKSLRSKWFINLIDKFILHLIHLVLFFGFCTKKMLLAEQDCRHKLLFALLTQVCKGCKTKFEGTLIHLDLDVQ